MGIWDLAYYSWFAFLGLSVCAVFGAAFWDSTAVKRQQRKALREAVTEKAAEEELEAEEEPAPEDEEVEAVAPEAEAAPEELDEQNLT